MKSSEYIEKHFQPGDLIQLKRNQHFLTTKRVPVSIRLGETIMFLGKFESVFFGLEGFVLYQYLTKEQILLDYWGPESEFEKNCIIQLYYVRLE